MQNRNVKSPASIKRLIKELNKEHKVEFTTDENVANLKLFDRPKQERHKDEGIEMVTSECISRGLK